MIKKMPHIAKFRKKFGHGLYQHRKKEIVHHGKNQIQSELAGLKCKKTNAKIAVVGAGFAGLYTAWLLKQLGLNITVYEAMDRVGGRVHSLYDFSEGNVVEAGAELIGLNHTILLHLCRIFDLSLMDVTSDDQDTALGLDFPIVLDGKRLSREESEKLEKELDALLMRISEAATIITNPAQPWLEPSAVQDLDNVSVGQILDEWGIKGNVRKIFDLETSNDNAASVYQQSWLGLLCQVRGGSLCCKPQEFWDIEELFRCAEGNQYIAKLLAKDIKRVHLNSPVKSIVYDRKNKRFTIHTKHKTKFYDYVVLATPPSMWKKIEFSPRFDLKPLKPKLGEAVKYISVVEDAFWLPQSWTPDGISNLIGYTWNSTANQSLVDGKKVLLTAFAGGKNAQKAVNIQKRKGNKAARKHFRKGIDYTYDGVFTESLIKDTLSFHSTIPYIETGYSYMGVGKVTTTGMLDNQPLEKYDGRMFFAGEYTSMIFFGYMEGALRSGLSVTKLIVDEINKRDS